jgi:hypothetical protein
MVLGRLLIVPMGANLLDANECSRKSLGLMVQLRGTRLVAKGITHKRRMKISLILIHQLLI